MMGGWVEENFINRTQKAQITKENIDTFDCMKRKTVALKDTINIVKPHTGKIFATHLI